MTAVSDSLSRPVRPHPRRALVLWVLTLLFALRVAGQAVERWMPQPLLPSFDEFQGSRLPYGPLLASQLAILVLMAHTAWRVRAGSLVPSRRAGRILGWAGSVYLTVSIGRIAVGLFVPGAAPWFGAWIPAAFHVVLAAFVVTLAFHHAVESRPHRERHA